MTPFLHSIYNMWICRGGAWIGGCQDLRWQERELLLKGCGFSFGVMRMFWNQLVMVITQYCECTKATVLFTLKWFILLCKFLFNFKKNESERKRMSEVCFSEFRMGLKIHSVFLAHGDLVIWLECN